MRDGTGAAQTRVRQELGPQAYGAYAKRVARRRTYGKTMGATRQLLKRFGLSK